VVFEIDLAFDRLHALEGCLWKPVGDVREDMGEGRALQRFREERIRWNGGFRRLSSLLYSRFPLDDILLLGSITFSKHQNIAKCKWVRHRRRCKADKAEMGFHWKHSPGLQILFRAEMS
jgi:hypothetical protein